jgi:hypothetical protein
MLIMNPINAAVSQRQSVRRSYPGEETMTLTTINLTPRIDTEINADRKALLTLVGEEALA